MMRFSVSLLLAAALALGVSACGTKGKLKTPSQIEAEEAKKARKAKREEQKQPAPPAPEQPSYIEEEPALPATPIGGK
jgi:predicted small lipoprotein YifL